MNTSLLTSPAMNLPQQGVPTLPSVLAVKQDAGAGVANSLSGTNAKTNSPEMREAFDDFVGQTFYGEMLKAMRSTVDEPAYFHGGRAEEIFEGQFDQAMSEHLSDATASTFTGPMYDLFMLPPPR